MGQKTLQNIVLTALTVCGFFALLLIAGDLRADSAMSDAQFITLKVGGLAIFGACVYVGGKLGKAGMLPGNNDKDIER